MTLKRQFFFCTAFLITFLFCLITTVSADNLLTNGDFIRIGNDGLPYGWDTDAYIQETGYTVFGITEGDQEHPAAVSIQNIGENDARFEQTVEVEPDTLYCLSGYIRAEGIQGGHGANLSIEGVYAFSDKCYDTEGEWEYIEYYGETGPEQHLLTVFARLGGYSGESTGKAFFADLSLEKTESVPGDGIADLWYRVTYDSDDNEEYSDEAQSEAEPKHLRNIILLIPVLYSAIALYILYHEKSRQEILHNPLHVRPVYTASVIILSFMLRMTISWFVEGYMVDVNCFLSWGNTMASVGPSGFYEATSFCDYPPLYTYVLALNSFIARVVPGSEGFTRISFRLIPNLCDLLGCWMLYRILLSQKILNHRSCFVFLAISVFNPAMILNSAAWGQMDSVLCLLLMCVAVCAVRGKWNVALPLYVAAVLVKPQALMLGPLGLAYIVITWIKYPGTHRRIAIGTGISMLTLAAGIIPFSLHQNWDWLIRLYIRTLGSYPYATVNTANLYYILGGNWSPVNGEAHFLAPVVLGILSVGYGLWWFFKAKGQARRIIETLISFAFGAGFATLGIMHASWAWIGGFAMAFAFVIVLTPAVRIGDIRFLPMFGGLLFILLYVFGVKMHERYIFPALLLLTCAWSEKKDRRILYIILLYTCTLFMNEFIVLDNSIRLGSSYGHLNRDTVWIADLISMMNVAGAVYTVWLGIELFLPGKSAAPRQKKPCMLQNWNADYKLHWKRKDTILLGIITAVYAAISLLTLGSTKAPQKGWSSSSADEQIVFDFGEYRNDVEILYFSQVSRYDFSFSASADRENWEEETWAQMDQGQCWKWKYVTESYDNGDGTRTYLSSDESNIIRFSGRYIRLTSHQLGLKLNEIVFRDPDGNILPVRIIDRMNAEPESELYSDPDALTDEQYTMEGLPSVFSDADTGNEKIQPSWWNSTYFDEIYHARTGFELLNGTVPYETSHPPLGKAMMSVWISVFGMTPFGWRFAGALAGILMIPGMYLIGKQLTKKTRIAVLSCLLIALDCMHLTQTQIATIDSFPVLFIIFSYYFMLRFIQTDFIREKLKTSLISLAFSGLFMGLSIASKWIGIYAGAGLAVLFFWHCARMIRMQRKAISIYGHNNIQEEDKRKLQSWLPACGASSASEKTAVICLWCVLFFIAIPVIIYLLSYIPYMAYNYRRIHSLWDYLNEVWRCQINMFNYHNTPGLGMDHPFYSPWWQWPIMGMPMYYASKQYLPADYPVHHSIFAFGNPVIWFSGLAAILLCLCRAAISRRYRTEENDYLWHIRSAGCDSRYLFIIIGILAQYLPWVLVPRGTYIYHYFATLPFLMTAICLSFDWKECRNEKPLIILSSVFIGAAAIFFVLLFPYASGMNVPDAWLDIGRHLARIWY